MEMIKLTMFIFLFYSCKVRNTEIANDKPSEKIVVKKDSCKLLFLYGDGFLKHSYLGIKHDTILFFNIDTYYKHIDQFFSKNMLFYDSTNRIFKNVSSIHRQLPDDSLQLLRNTNIYINSILKDAKRKVSPYYKKLLLNKALKPNLPFLTKESKINIFENKYYVFDESSYDSLYQVDLATKKVKAFYIDRRGVMSIMAFLLFDIDKDGNPEIFFFHDSDVPQKERLLYDVYSIRADSIKVNFVNEKTNL